MNNALQVFNYEGREIRTIEIDDEAWFVGKDVAEALGYKDTVNALKDHVYDEDKLTWQIATSGQRRDMTVINESGVYSLIFSSKLPSARQFKRWVTHEVLPSIRKSGIYMTDKAADAYINNPALFNAMVERCSTLEKRVAELEKQRQEEQALANLGIVVLAQKDAITFKDAADFLAQHGIEIGQNRLFKWGRDKKLLCSRKGRQWNKPTHDAIEKGLFNLQISGGFNTITMVTPRGMSYLTNELFNEQYPLMMLLAKVETE